MGCTWAPLIAWSTAGSVAGSLLLYWLGAAIGLDRAIRPVERSRVVSRHDLERGAAWFARRGAWSVLIGRLVPGVRSLISIPRGASRMHLGLFVLCTAVGSGIWNATLIGLGAARGTQRDAIDPVLNSLDVVVSVLLGVALVVLVVRRIRSRTPS